eukprot:SAG11_NODE_13572_length_649_cov_0.821818_2_plen_102_part_01
MDWREMIDEANAGTPRPRPSGQASGAQSLPQTPLLGTTMYICKNNAVVTREIESQQHEILRKIAPGERVVVVNIGTTSTGQRRAQTKDGWISIVSANGTILL